MPADSLSAASRRNSSLSAPPEKTPIDTRPPSLPESNEKQLTSPAEEDDQYLEGLPLYMVMVSVWLGVFLVALDQTIVSTAIPDVTNQFKSFNSIGWYASSYLLTSASFQPVFGRIYERFSVKWTYIVATLIFQLGSVICAAATSSEMFIVGRAIAGLGFSGGYVGSVSIVALVSPMRIRPLMTSSIGAVYCIGAVLGPLLGGVFTSKVSWRWCFWINPCLLPPVLITAVLYLRVRPRPVQGTVWQRLKPIDWQGTALLMGSLICLLLVFQWGGFDYAWSDSTIIGLIVGFVVILGVFVLDQWYMGDNALIPFRVVKQRTVGFGSIVSFAVGGVYFSLLYLIPLYYQSILGSSPIRSGVQMLPFVASDIVAILASGAVINITGIYMPYLIAGSLLASVGSGTLYLLRPDSSTAFWAGLTFFAGIGPGMAFMIPFTAVQSVLPASDLEVGSAVVIFGQTLGGTIFASLTQSVWQNYFKNNLGQIPGVDPKQVLAYGASAFRVVLPPQLLPVVTDAASRALNKGWLVTAALGALAFLACFGMELNRRVSGPGAVMMA